MMIDGSEKRNLNFRIRMFVKSAGVFRGDRISSPKNACGGGYTNGCCKPKYIPFPLCLWSNEQTNHVQEI